MVSDSCVCGAAGVFAGNVGERDSVQGVRRTEGVSQRRAGEPGVLRYGRDQERDYEYFAEFDRDCGELCGRRGNSDRDGLAFRDPDVGRRRVGTGAGDTVPGAYEGAAQEDAGGGRRAAFVDAGDVREYPADQVESVGAEGHAEDRRGPEASVRRAGAAGNVQFPDE